METAIWILAADCSRARVFEAGRIDRQLYQLKDFVNRNGGSGLRGQDCSAGGEASSADILPARGSAEPHPARRFARQLAEYLEKARSEQRYDGLYVIAPSRFLGVLRATLPQTVRKLVAEEIDKRVSDSRVEEIEAHVRDKLRLVYR